MKMMCYIMVAVPKIFDDDEDDEDTTCSKTKNAASSLPTYHWSSLCLMPPVFFYLPEFLCKVEN